MTLGIIKRTTPNFSFRIPFFDGPNWGRELERNFDTIDAILFAATGFTNVKGVWTNNTEYDAGDRVVDPADGSTWQANVDHTSAAAGTFDDDRTAHPTYWALLSQTFNNRGQWTTATNYNINEFVYDDHRYGVALAKFTSGASYNADVAAGKLITLIDLKTAYDDTQSAKTTAVNAMNSATASAAAALASQNSATASATAANNSKVAAATSETNAGTSATNAAASETNANNSKNAAATSASNAATSETNAAVSAAAALASKNAAATSETNAAASAATAVDNVPVAIHAASAKSTPADADELGIADSAASWALKKITFTTLWTYVATKLGIINSNAFRAIISFLGTAARTITIPDKDMTLGISRSTTQSTASGTTKDFTVPAGATRIWVALDTVSFAGADDILVQIGNGTPETTGYTSGSASASGVTNGFLMRLNLAARAAVGLMTLMNTNGNTWIEIHNHHADTTADFNGGGRKTTSNPVTIVRVTGSAGGAFDGGEVTVFWEF